MGEDGVSHTPRGQRAELRDVSIRDDQVVVKSQLGQSSGDDDVSVVGPSPPGTLRGRVGSSRPGRRRGASQCLIVATLVALMGAWGSRVAYMAARLPG